MHHALVLAAVPLIALVFAPGLHSAFLVPKTFVLMLFTSVLLVGEWPRIAHARAFWIAIVVWLLILLLSGIHSTYPDLRAEALAFAVSGPLLLLGTQQVLQRDSVTWQNVLVATGVIIALIVIAQSVWDLDLFRIFGSQSGVAGRMRAFGTLGNPLFAGVFLAPTLTVSHGQAQRSGNPWFTAFSFLIATGVALTGSRTALFAAAAGLVLTTAKPTLQNVATGVLLIGITVAISTRINQRTVSEAALGRASISRIALQDGISLLGSGPGTFAVTYPAKLATYFAGGNHKLDYRFAGYERHAHNEWTESLVENGALGLASFIAVLLTWFWTIRRQPLTTDRRIGGGVVIVLALAAGSDFTFHRAETWALLWMAMGIALPTGAPISRRAPLYMWAAKVVLAALLLWMALPPLLASRAISRGMQAELQNDPVRAISGYQAALRWQPASPDANFNLTRALCKQGALDACWSQSEHARRYVDEAELYILRARCLEAQGRFLEAGVELAQARERFPFSKALQK
jgi:hypothetical protein